MDSISSHPEKLLTITQDGCSIESYVEEFLHLAHHVHWNDDTLKIVFWSGLNNHLFLLAPPATTPGSLAQYIDYVLNLAGSSFTVEEVPVSQPPSTAKSVYPLARKWASNSADLRAKVLDPSFTSVRSALKSFPHLPSQPPPAVKSESPPSAAMMMPQLTTMIVPPPETAMMVPPPAATMMPSATAKCSSESPLVPSSSSESPLVPSSSSEPLLVPSSSSEPLLVPSSSSEPLLVPSSSSEPLLVPSSSPEPLLVPSSSPEPLLVPSSSPEPLLVPSSSPEPLLVPSSSPELPPEPAPRQRTPEPAPRQRTPEPAPRQRTPEPAPRQRTPEPAPPERPLVPAPPERPLVPAPPERPTEPAPPEWPLEGNLPKKIFWGGHIPLVCVAGPRTKATELPDLPWPPKRNRPWSPEPPDPPWPPESPDPPWPPEYPDPPWLPEPPVPPWPPEFPDPPWRLPQSLCQSPASRAPTPPPQCYYYGAGRAFREGEVMSRICLSCSLTKHSARPHLVSLEHWLNTPARHWHPITPALLEHTPHSSHCPISFLHVGLFLDAIDNS